VRKILFDTHVLMDYLNGSRAAFSDEIMRHVDGAVSEGLLFVSQISIWEIINE
jgi:PIN domain nuclease of toxin-antitoxin system